MRKDVSGLECASIKYSYSMCEFLERLQQDVSLPNIRAAVEKVLVGFLFTHPYIGYTKEYLRVVTFLLCFCTPAEATYIFSNLIYYVVPPPLYPKQAQSSALKTVEQYIRYMI